MTPRRAVLFDIGGPIDTEVLSEQRKDAAILDAVRAEGFSLEAPDVAAASERAVRAYAPDAYAAMIFDLCLHDAAAARRAYAHFHAAASRDVDARIQLRPGIAELLRELHGRGVLLGLAANQPARVIDDLAAHGLAEAFSHREVSGHHGFRKPDVRLFLRACEDLRVAPEECIMVGDRIDNDIAPAKVLGMGTVLFRTGRHLRQQPRSLAEVPDVEVWDVEQLSEALSWDAP